MRIVFWDESDESCETLVRNGPEDKFEDQPDRFYALKERVSGSVGSTEGRFIPSVRERRRPDGRLAYDSGIVWLRTDRICHALKGNDPWLQALVKLTERRYSSILRGEGRLEPYVRFWHAGGAIPYPGLRRPKSCELELAILAIWGHWKSPAFKRQKKLKLWFARLESLKEKGFHEPLTVARLKKAFYFLFPARQKSDDQKTKLRKSTDS